MVRHVRPNRLLNLGVVAAVAALLTACGAEPVPATAARSETTGMVAGALDTAAPGAMVVYSPKGKPVKDSDFVWLGPPETLGGRVLEGNPQIYARVDYSKNGTTAGVFKATPGKIEVTFPFSEHATIIDGEVTITDQTGESHTFKAGDSYFIRQGSVVIWEVKGKKDLIKSFFNTVEAP